MNAALGDLFIIFCAAAVSAVVTRFVPRQFLPDGVVLIAFGSVVGPFALDWITPGESITIMGNIGTGLMFLLAGYEIEPRNHFGPRGRRAALLWLVCLGLALLLGQALSVFSNSTGATATAIALVATALGTVTPMLKSRGLGAGTRLGDAVLRHGTAGQMGAPVALAVLLGVRGSLASSLVLLAFLCLVAVLFTVPDLIRRRMGWLVEAIREGSRSSTQTDVRLVMVVLLGLLLLTGALGLDSIMAAFLAGVVVREAFPDEHSDLAVQLHAVAFGIFIPVFLVLAGMNIDLAGLARSPWIALAFLGANLVVRVLPVALYSWRVDGFAPAEAAQIGLYTGIGLGLVAAVTQAAVQAGAMTATDRSALVATACIVVVLHGALARALARRVQTRVA
ncbi:cation:proton antiporter [Actinomyces provencensis]|uniref:cation:proton antiporter n=1 Tax=Actinomyces provencensis TaxID=1720198 RepID=UPI00096A9AC5|nr:cation:proton antiporter [Actinomyces provencensis]